jgi:hypothetical protein
MRNRDTCLDIEDLCRAIAASGDISAVQTETNAADHTLMGQVVNQVDIKDTTCAGVKDGKPIGSLFLEVIWELLQIQVSENIALAQWRSLLVCAQERVLMLMQMLLMGRGCGPRNLRRARIRRSGILLRGRRSWRSSRPRSGTWARAATLSTWRSSRLRRLTIT